MSDVDYLAEAKGWIPGTLQSSFDQTRDAIALAQANATIALAEQQRIANVIAAARLSVEAGGGTRGGDLGGWAMEVEAELHGRLADSDIRKALGLGL